MKSFLFLLVVACIIAVFYFSWLPNPNLGTEIYLPSWLLEWSNYYYNLRTAVPFVAIGFLLEASSRIKKTKEEVRSTLRLFIQNTAFSAVIICIAEGGQLVLQNRTSDFRDVFFGVMGSLTRSLVYYVLRPFFNLKKISDEK
ncbi:hypothetical protein [Flavobacterium sp. DSR3-2]|uniref:hypothetical protein n=1 Tax=Flavobacterium sp. DSR3-2 TaxID=2804634 RepID=UPI003CF2A399